MSGALVASESRVELARAARSHKAQAAHQAGPCRSTPAPSEMAWGEVEAELRRYWALLPGTVSQRIAAWVDQAVPDTTGGDLLGAVDVALTRLPALLGLLVDQLQRLGGCPDLVWREDPRVALERVADLVSQAAPLLRKSAALIELAATEAGRLHVLDTAPKPAG